MDLRRRFIFHGNAAAIGGRLVRPVNLVLDSATASVLTVVGGRSSARAVNTRFGEWVSFREASTLAEGVFDDVKQQIELTYGRVAEDALLTSTHVSAEVLDLTIAGKPQLTVKRLHGALSSRSPAGSGEPPISPGADTAIEGVAVDGHELIVDLDLALFQKCDTRAKLLTAADDPRFVEASGDCLFMKATFGGRPAPPVGRLLHAYGMIPATIVKAVRWAGDPYPGARIDHHSVTVPDFGKIFFGELLIADMSRRLTMMRLDLGSPLGGSLACGEVQSNGTWSN
jgi:hypothetical protein